MPDIDFTQFGPYAITVALLIAGNIYQATQNRDERKRTDDQINLRIVDQKEAKESSDKSMNEMLILLRQIYAFITNSNSKER
jgi:hypothetical protein